MKNYLAALSATALISFAPFTLAASSTELTVTGFITPSACMPELSSGGIINIGKISAKGLNPNTQTRVGVHTMQLSVSCNETTRFALKPTDNREGTSARVDRFGLGLTDANEKLGWFLIGIDTTSADKFPARAIASRDEGETWRRTEYIYPSINLISVGATADTSTPIPVKDLTIDLQVNTYIDRADRLTLTNEVTIDGAVTFEMEYL